MSAPIRHQGVIAREIDGEFVILNHETELVHQLNATAGYIWDCCDGQRSVVDITLCVAERFNVSTDVAATDVTATIGQLQKFGLLKLGQSGAG